MVPGWDTLCRHWIKGHCKFGDGCAFEHGLQPHQQTVPSSSVPSSAGALQASSGPAASAAHQQSATTLAASAAQASSASGSSGASAAAQPPGSSSANARKNGKGWPKQAARIWAHIELFKLHPVFDLVPILIGLGGENTSNIFKQTGAKIRIRGRGSGHLEVLNSKGEKMSEAPVPLMIAVTSEKSATREFRKAVEMCVQLLGQVAASFKIFCAEHKLPPEIENRQLFYFMEVSRGSEPLLVDLLRRFPHPEGPRANCKTKKKVTPGGMRPRLQMNATAEPYDGPPQHSPTSGFQLNAAAEPFVSTIHTATCTGTGTGTCGGFPSAGEGDAAEAFVSTIHTATCTGTGTCGGFPSAGEGDGSQAQGNWSQQSVAQVIQEWYASHSSVGAEGEHWSLLTWPTLDASWARQATNQAMMDNQPHDEGQMDSYEDMEFPTASMDDIEATNQAMMDNQLHDQIVGYDNDMVRAVCNFILNDSDDDM